MKKKSSILLILLVCFVLGSIFAYSFVPKIRQVTYWNDYTPYWISPQEIIFDSSRSGEEQIWSVDIKNEKVKQLTSVGSNLSLIFKNVVSPNKQKVLFVANDLNIWELDMHSMEEKCILSYNSQLKLCQYTVDGRGILFVRGKEIHRLDITTGQEDKIIIDGEILDLDAKTMQAIIVKGENIYSVNLQKPDSIRFLTKGVFSLETQGAYLSPQGNKLLFFKMNEWLELWMIDVNTLKEIQIIQGVKGNYYQTIGSLFWLPAGDKICCTYWLVNKNNFSKVKDRSVLVIDIKKNIVYRTMKIPAIFSCSPDGKKIAFCNNGIWIANLE